MDANTYLKINERQNGTEWKKLPFDFSWKMKELLFFGLADRHSFQVSGYQQEAIYIEKSQVCNANPHHVICLIIRRFFACPHDAFHTHECSPLGSQNLEHESAKELD